MSLSKAIKTLMRLTLFCCLILLISCEKNENNYLHFNVTVIGQGLDCGDLFLITVNNNLEELYKITGQEGWQTCYAYDLAEKYKVNGKTLLVKLRATRDDEYFACTDMGPAYPWVTVVEAEEIFK